MKEKRTTIHLIEPVGSSFLASVCKNISADYIMEDMDFYTCEICEKKFPFSKVNLHKDFFICDSCATKKDLTFEHVTVVSFLKEKDDKSSSL